MHRQNYLIESGCSLTQGDEAVALSHVLLEHGKRQHGGTVVVPTFGLELR